MAAKRQVDEGFYLQLSSAVERDDLNSFNQCMQVTNCGAVRFGRFPMLSALYLCRSKKILKKYEKSFLKMSANRQLKEPLYLSVKLREVAGKCLRFYAEETVSPLEVLLLCDRTAKLKKIYPAVPISPAVNERLKNIYSIRYGQDVTFKDNAIILSRPPLSFKTKKLIAATCADAVFFAACGASIPFIIDSLKPFKIDADGNYRVSRASAIDFASSNTYILEKNITLPIDFKAAEVHCRIDGNGKKITFEGDSTAFESFCGVLENATLVTGAAAPIINRVEPVATLKNLTVEASVSAAICCDYAVLANINLGRMADITLNMSGSLNIGEPTEQSSSLTLGGLAISNHRESNGFTTYYGIIENCIADYSGFTLTGVNAADACFGGIAGANYGQINKCKATGKIDADTVDIAGICGRNYYSIYACTNEAGLIQKATSESWNPTVAGIAVFNNYSISFCKNSGALHAENNCAPSTEDGSMPDINIAGIAAHNRFYTNSAMSLVYSLGVIKNCVSSGKITATATQGVKIFAGGIVAENAEGLFFKNSYNEGYYGGSINNCYFTGEIETAGYIGGIVAKTGKNLAEYNLYYENDKECHNLWGNVYLAGSGAEYGIATVVTYDERYMPGTLFISEYGDPCEKESVKTDLQAVESDEVYKNILSALTVQE